MIPVIATFVVALATLAFGRTRKTFVVRPTDPGFRDAVNRALATIRRVESGGNYKAQNPHSSASGAYQFIDQTWGNFGGYARAADAPSNVQDDKARKAIIPILTRHNCDFTWIPAVWYAGMSGAEKLNWDTVISKNKLSIKAYVDKWMGVFYSIGTPKKKVTS